jgi:hypothetical protein
MPTDPERARILDELVADAAEHGLYESTAEPLAEPARYTAEQECECRGMDEHPGCTHGRPLDPRPDPARELLREIVEHGMGYQPCERPGRREAWARARALLDTATGEQEDGSHG